VVFFSDAVFAIAMTVLVFTLEIPVNTTTDRVAVVEAEMRERRMIEHVGADRSPDAVVRDPANGATSWIHSVRTTRS
jgi:transmembrane protein TMEM174 (potassium channel)